MSPQLHTESPPRVPGDSLRGKRPHDYGPGRVCPTPGCGTILRRTHKGPVCDPCQDNHRCGPSACSEAAPKAAPAVRATNEEATVPRDEVHNRCEDVLEMMRGGKWWTAAELGERLGVSRQRVHTMTKQLREAGHTIQSQAGIGTRLVKEKLCETSSEGEESAKTAPATPPAPAPVTPPPEQPADVAPASDTLPPQARLAPFAGIHVLQMECRGLGRELSILDELEGLDDGARERVLGYASRAVPESWTSSAKSRSATRTQTSWRLRSSTRSTASRGPRCERPASEADAPPRAHGELRRPGGPLLVPGEPQPGPGDSHWHEDARGRGASSGEAGDMIAFLAFVLIGLAVVGYLLHRWVRQ